MVDPSVLGPLAGVSESVSEYYEFWKEYKGEEILIRDHSVTLDDDEKGKIKQNVHVIRGTVEDVTSFPPGFLLKDVEEYIELSNVSLLWGANSTTPLDAVGGSEGRQPLRKVDEKYVSFSSIEQIERAEVADDAIEPFRTEDE
ncbi:hypothetical protein [Natrinema sp. CGMCC1.2065]|uniref:hypothetical protein n=1 Tax=Natrinema sp. CGMCC1.2065 TaxID=3445767 RepID=UPI003F4A0149